MVLANQNTRKDLVEVNKEDVKNNKYAARARGELTASS